MEAKLENLTPAPEAETSAVRHIAADNQVGAGDTKVTAAATDALVQNKALPDLHISGLENEGASSTLPSQVETNSTNKPLDNQDVLRAADEKAIHDAKAGGNRNIKYDDEFYRNVDKSTGTGALGNFDPKTYESAGRATTRSLSTEQAKTDATVTVPVSNNLHQSSRLTGKADGSADTTVRPGDSLWKIAREALKQNKPEEYRPSDREVLDAVRKIARENHLRTPDKIHPGEKLHIPKELIARRPEVAPPTETAKPPEVPVEIRNASPEFAAEVKRQFDTLPENVRRLLADSGNKIVVGGKLSDADPSLAGVRPRGWPPGTTWDDDDGLFNPRSREITVAQTHHDKNTDTFVQNDRAEGSIKHEAGHAVDLALGSMSHSDDFKRAFDADVAKMTPAEKQRFGYLLQDGHAGHEETFAEVFGAMHGSSANRSESQAILNDFPEVRALMQRRLAQLH